MAEWEDKRGRGLRKQDLHVMLPDPNPAVKTGTNGSHTSACLPAKLHPSSSVLQYSTLVRSPNNYMPRQTDTEKTYSFGTSLSDFASARVAQQLVERFDIVWKAYDDLRGGLGLCM